ncbi:DUF4864 domain-containing protein [Rubrivirga sp. IMCC45206]|uniref:DUF4864 domain-containing protein n=1 Tax=Rubrivirga sp. IMCC45206 TaxID=3391614 RepID=UPI00398F9A71
MHALSVVLALVGTAAVVLLAAGPNDPQPSPDLTAEEVVRIQVEALGANDTPTPDAGIATAFRFASPGNRAATGPLERFTQMVKGPVYRDMIDATSADYGRVVVEGDRAALRVALGHADGRRAVYVFALSRQQGGACDGCWLTDGVERREPVADGQTRI